MREKELETQHRHDGEWRHCRQHQHKPRKPAICTSIVC
jgi:hypothetical protein